MVLNPRHQKAKDNQHHITQQADGVEIIYYTDPLCCWSWAFEPQWRKLQFEFDGKISVRYCMSGLLPGWKNFHDPVNSVSRPIQMGPVWMHAAQLSGMPIEHNIWMKNPPASSYPACIAVKCAALQSSIAGEMYLRLAREEVMLKGNNTAKQVVLLKLATTLNKLLPSFDINTFEQDLSNDNGLEAFRSDMKEVRYHNINRFPSLIIKNLQHEAVFISGYRPYIVLLEALKKVSPGLIRTRVTGDEKEYSATWPTITLREIEEGITNID